MRYAVIIPVYNRASTLARAVESALAQTLAPDQILIIDDGSTDRSWDVAMGLSCRHPAVKLLRLANNRGAPAARNAGAAMVTSDFLAFLDSDDEWASNKAERQLELMRNAPASPAAFTNLRFIWDDQTTTTSDIPSLVHRADLIYANRLGSTSSAMVKREAFSDVGGFAEDMPSCQDWELWLRLAVLGPLPVTPEALTLYHFDSAGRISSDAGRLVAGQARITAALLAEQPSVAARRRLRSAHAMNVAEVLVRQTVQRAKALSLAGTALIQSPSPGSVIRAAKVVGHALRLPHGR